MAPSNTEVLLRRLVNLFPPLRIALLINDFICWIFKSFSRLVGELISVVFSLTFEGVKRLSSKLSVCLSRLNLWTRENNLYQRLDKRKPHKEPIPYQNQFFHRSLTYHLGLILGALLYLFVYFVLIKHHTYTSILIATLLMLAYLVIVENSHNIRSILMLSLPIMFTNRGRALVFCSMLAIMVSGPVKNTQMNINELHYSLNCSRQFMIIKADRFVDKNVIQNLVRVEDIVRSLVANIKEFADEILAKFTDIINLAITVGRFIEVAILKLQDIVKICNSHTQGTFDSCNNKLQLAYDDCKVKLGSKLDGLCEIVQSAKGFCNTVKLPQVLCQIPDSVAQYLDQTIGQRLRFYRALIVNEFRVDIDPGHNYTYKGVKSKSNMKIFGEIKFDVKQKFWYIHLISRAFNLVSLVLVIWIMITATLYHMHYLTDLKYDNMYLDENLRSVDEYMRKPKQYKTNIKSQFSNLGKTSISREKDISDTDSSDGTQVDSGGEGKPLLPLPSNQEELYIKPFGTWMNSDEKQKLWISGFIWAAIVGYISVFVVLDYSLYQLITMIEEILRGIFFSGDLPLVDIVSRTDSDREIRYNRSYINELRRSSLSSVRSELTRVSDNSSDAAQTYRQGSIGSMYRKLMDSLEKSIPDDIAILDSVERCFPIASEPNLNDYKNLVYLAAFTFGAVVMEAYAMRTRHCIANLYYPIQAKRRAVWLYKKLAGEKERFEIDALGRTFNQRGGNKKRKDRKKEIVENVPQLLIDHVAYKK